MIGNELDDWDVFTYKRALDYLKNVCVGEPVSKFSEKQKAFEPIHDFLRL